MTFVNLTPPSVEHVEEFLDIAVGKHNLLETSDGITFRYQPTSKGRYQSSRYPVTSEECLPPEGCARKQREFASRQILFAIGFALASAYLDMGEIPAENLQCPQFGYEGQKLGV